MVLKKSYVEVNKVIFKSGERTANIPEDTKNVPYEMFVKGYLLKDSKIGESVSVKTDTGRIVNGILLNEDPTYELDYGNNVPEILMIKKILWDVTHE